MIWELKDEIYSGILSGLAAVFEYAFHSFGSEIPLVFGLKVGWQFIEHFGSRENAGPLIRIEDDAYEFGPSRFW